MNANAAERVVEGADPYDGEKVARGKERVAEDVDPYFVRRARLA